MGMTKESDAKWRRRDFRMVLSINIFFLTGSVLYVWLTVLDYYWAVDTKDIPDHLLEVDDDYTWYEVQWEYGLEDDYVFDINENVWVSQAMIVYTCAALCFVVTGVLDFFYHPSFLAITFILAGVFGLFSALGVEANEDLSNIFNLISVHLFFFEAVQILRIRNSFRGVKNWFRLADGMFVVATLTDVIVGYILVFGDLSPALSATGIASASLWLGCSIIYLGITLHIRMQGGLNNPEDDEEKKIRPLPQQDTKMTDDS